MPGRFRLLGLVAVASAALALLVWAPGEPVAQPPAALLSPQRRLGSTATSPAPASAGGCSCPGSNGQRPDVALNIMATIQDYPIKNAEAGIDAVYRTRTFCEFSPGDFTPRCEGLGIHGPTLNVKPGQLVEVKLYNGFDVKQARALGPHPPTLEAWFPLANNQTGRYAGLQGCGFVFTGKSPKTPAEFIRDTTNMPGHHDVQYEGTNLHFHGMEIMPHLFAPLATSNPEAEMIRIPPGECLCYSIKIPENHPAGGTYWYHPHMHSSTAIQAWSGMAGLIRVAGDLDEVLAANGVEQDSPFIIWDPHFRELPDSGTEGVAARGFPAKGAGAAVRQLLGPRQPLGVDFFLRDQTDQANIWYLVNAQYQPTFRLRPGETIRLRLLCGTTENLAGFEIINDLGYPVPFWVVGSDGITYHRPVRRTRLVLAGGQREELLVQLPEPGRYHVVSRGLTKVQFFCTGPPDAVLATLDVAGEAWPKPLDPEQLRIQAPKVPIQPEEIVASRTVTMSMKADRSRVPFPQFMQNGKPYNETSVEFRIRAGTAEEWIVMNPDRTMHPFHVHVGNFQVKEMHSSYMPDDEAMKIITYVDPALDNWRDSVQVPSQGFVKIWIRWPADLKGKTVAHCHFLAHEDTGMMMNILLE